MIYKCFVFNTGVPHWNILVWNTFLFKTIILWTVRDGHSVESLASHRNPGDDSGSHLLMNRMTDLPTGSVDSLRIQHISEESLSGVKHFSGDKVRQTAVIPSNSSQKKGFCVVIIIYHSPEHAGLQNNGPELKSRRGRSESDWASAMHL